MNSKSKLVVVLFVLCFQLQAQTQIVAHRGFWNTEGSAQNSLAALQKANKIGVYGSEMDIWLSSDGVPVVYHDAYVTLDNKKLRVQDTPVNILKQVQLSNGEHLPTLADYLNTFERCNDTKLIIEFKKHRTKYQEDELAEKVLKMIHDRSLQNRVEYLSFSLNFVVKTIHLDPMAKVYYLNGNLSPDVMREIGAAGIDYNVGVIKKYPEWVKESHDLGLKVNVWTVNELEDIEQMIGLNVDFITTDEPLLVRDILNR